MAWPGTIRIPGVGRAVQNAASSASKGPPQGKPPAPRPPVGGNGVVVAIGPMDREDLENVHLTHWLTFPVTPESIPVAFAGQHADGRFTLQDGEASQFVGPALRESTFSGRLEPPEFYFPTGTGLSNAAVLAAIQAGQLHGVAAVHESFDRSPRATTDQSFRYSVPYIQGGASVVMQDGAHPGPSVYLEPPIFAEIIGGIVESGEVVRLVIGDHFGWNFPATIRSFTPRFEDPDPDTYLFDITFKGWRRRELYRVGQGTGSKGKTTYKTRVGDTLHIIAARELGSSSKWGTLARLNASTLNKLWYYPDLDTIGPRITGKTGGSQFSSSGKGAHVPPTMVFRAGVTLKLRKAKAKSTLTATARHPSVSVRTP